MGGLGCVCVGEGWISPGLSEQNYRGGDLQAKDASSAGGKTVDGEFPNPHHPTTRLTLLPTAYSAANCASPSVFARFALSSP